jgi:hypothetical protein
MVLYLYARLALSLWYYMHNYYYDIVCMQNYVIIPLVRFCDVLYIELCIDHDSIFINSSPENHKYISVFLSSASVYQPYRPVTDPNRTVNRLTWRLI